MGPVPDSVTSVRMLRPGATESAPFVWVSTACTFSLSVDTVTPGRIAPSRSTT